MCAYVEVANEISNDVDVGTPETVNCLYVTPLTSLYVPAVPPVPPDTFSTSLNFLAFALSKACLIVLYGCDSVPGRLSLPLGETHNTLPADVPLHTISLPSVVKFEPGRPIGNLATPPSFWVIISPRVVNTAAVSPCATILHTVASEPG